MKLLIKNLLLIIFSCILCISTTGCSSKKNSSELEEFTIVLDWYPNAVHGFIYEAIEKGYYKEEGLDVKIQFPSNTNDALSLTAAGKADAGIYYLQDVIMARANENIPVKAIGSVVQKPLNIILSLKEKNITSPTDLAGKKIGYAGTVLSEAIIRSIVESTGNTMDNIQLVDVGFDLMSSMTTKNVDATIGCLVNHEVPQMENDGFELNYFFPTDYGMPDYYELVFVTGDHQINKESDKLSRFLRASQKGFADMKANPDKALDTLLQNQNEENFPLNKSVEKQSFDYLIPVMETEQNPFLSQDESVWQENIDWLYSKGIIEKKPEASEVFVNLDF